MANHRPQKTALLIAQRIVADIDQSSLESGDRLPPEKEMLEKYEVGRGTLRESLRYLELQGVLNIKPGPGGGPIVQSPDGSSLANTLLLLLQFIDTPYSSIAEARLALEPVMTGLAAKRISDENLAALAETLETMDSDIDNHSLFLEANKRFHDVIAWSSGNPLFGLIVDAILDIMDGSELGINYPIHRRKPIIEAHRKIYDALKAGDSEAAEEAMHRHISEYAVYAQRKYPEVFKRKVTWKSLHA